MSPNPHERPRTSGVFHRRDHRRTRNRVARLTLLAAEELCAFYGDFQALFDVSIKVDAGQIVAIIGANGAGKSTLLKSLVGLHPVAASSVRYRGKAVGGSPAYELVRQGIALVPEGRRLFPSLTVAENLRMGEFAGRGGPWTLPTVLDLFPSIAQRHDTPATALSGGQQQMVAIGRALLTNPTVLLCDELSLGLAPIVVRDIYSQLAQIRSSGTAVVIVEQDVAQAMRVADQCYCFRQGALVLAGRPGELGREQISAAYFGL